MDFFKSQYTRVQEQLAALSASQKMLAGSLAAIMVMTLMFWSHWAADPDMEPLLNQSMTTEEITTINNSLDAMNINHKVVGDRVYVPTDRKFDVLAQLGYSQTLPTDFNQSFDDLVLKDSNPLEAPDKTASLFLEAKSRMLQKVIGSFPGVNTAVVVIDPTTERNIGGPSTQASAAIYIKTSQSGHENLKQLAESAGDLVAGSQANLLRSRISVIVDNHHFPLSDPGDEDSSDIDGSVLENQQQQENAYCEKIRNGLSFIQNLMVTVNVKLDTAYTVTKTHTVDPKNAVHLESHIEEQSQDTSSSDPGSTGEPGATPNTSLTVGGSPSGGGGPTNTSTSSDNKTDFVVDNNNKDQVIKQGPGSAVVTGASVRVPDSYFVAAYKNKNGGKDPDEAALKTLEDSELAMIRQEVKAATGLTDDNVVVVGTYMDVAPTDNLLTAPASTSTPTASLAMVGSHAKEIGIGVLAFASLFMVSMMVRKGPEIPVIVTESEPSGPNMLRAGDAIVGHAAEGGAPLEGMELDDDSVKAQQMLDQVQQMVQTNPDGAANLVKRWMNHS